MSRTGTARAATVSKQLRRAGFIVGRTGINEHEADVMVVSSDDEVRVQCWVRPNAEPARVIEQTQEIIVELVNKGYDIRVGNHTDDPDAPCTFLHLSRPKWRGLDEVSNRLGDITGDELVDLSQSPAADDKAVVTPQRQREIVVGAVATERNAPRVLSVPDRAEKAVAKRDSNLKRTGGGLVIEEIVHDEAAFTAVVRSGGQLKRCQCGGPKCTATTKRNFAPGHDAAMVSRWAARVAEGVADLSDAERNILAAGGSEAMVGKVRAAVARKRAKNDRPVERPVRVRVQMTVELTPGQVEGLSREYGCGTSDAEVREFVRSYIVGDAIGSVAGEQFWSVSN